MYIFSVILNILPLCRITGLSLTSARATTTPLETIHRKSYKRPNFEPKFLAFNFID